MIGINVVLIYKTYKTSFFIVLINWITRLKPQKVEIFRRDTQHWVGIKFEEDKITDLQPWNKILNYISIMLQVHIYPFAEGYFENN